VPAGGRSDRGCGRLEERADRGAFRTPRAPDARSLPRLLLSCSPPPLPLARSFIGYAAGAVRVSALSHFRVIYVGTHDSIGLGEDGPTHQPVEMLESLRTTPNMFLYRPCDGNEVSAAYALAVSNSHAPAVIALSRQNVPHQVGSTVEVSSTPQRRQRQQQQEEGGGSQWAGTGLVAAAHRTLPQTLPPYSHSFGHLYACRRR
jgi:hypothetical protein